MRSRLLAAAVLASMAASLPAVALAEAPARSRRTTAAPKPYQRNRTDPLASEREAHNRAVENRKAEKRARKGRGRG